MKEKRILYILGQVNEKYIVEAAPGKGMSRKPGGKKLVVIAACLVLLLALSTAAYAANWFGLRDLLLPIFTGNSWNEDGGNAAISLAGYQGSPEWQALAEWQAFINEYDSDGAIYQSKDGRLDSSFARYSCYLVYSQEMADKLDEITARYGLKLHTTSYNLQERPDLLESIKVFRGYYTYMYEDGTFEAEGTIDFADIGAWDFRFLRSVRGTFHDAMLDIGDISEYQEKYYDAACGVPVTLALGQNSALILADLKDSLVTVYIPYGSNSGIQQSHLEILADSINFAALTPVVKPRADDTVQETERDMGARKLYAAALRNLIYSDVLPDGEKAELPAGSYSQFAIGDVDADGKEELVLIYDPDVTAAVAGYIVGYDPVGRELYVQLKEESAFTFLENGSLKALSSHNQTYGDMWPYYLYQYLPKSDSYELRGYVYSEDKNVFEAIGKAEQYPGHADISGTGTVYYIDTLGTTPLDEADYLAWLEVNQADAGELEIEYLPLTEENILAIE